MKKYVGKVVTGIAFTLLLVIPTQSAHAGIIEIIKQIIVKAIKAADLEIQRQQNKQIDLQNAQKQLENEMAKKKLKEIADWTQKQKEQYEKYFDELKKVKAIIANYQRVRSIMQMQTNIINEHNRVWNLIRSDDNFSPQELKYMEQVYSGMLQQTLNNVRQLRLVITSYTMKMSDAKRMEIANVAAEEAQRSYDDLRIFNNQNLLLGINRAKERNQTSKLKTLYGIN